MGRHSCAMAEEKSESPELRGSPTTGCLILAAIVIVFGGLIVLYLVVGNIQTKAIDGFTQDEPAKLETVVTTDDLVSASMAKLKQVEEAVQAGRSERITFTAEDLNVLIATLEVAKDFRGNTYVESINSDGILAHMAQPLRKGIIAKGFRYLNAKFLLEPELRKRTFAFKVRDIRPAEGKVPLEFIKNYAVIDFFKIDPENEAIKANIPHLAAIYTEKDLVVVETKVAEATE